MESRPLGSAYVLESLIGRGAMGQVWRGYTRDDNTPIAVKLLRPELMDETNVVTRFLQERAILTGLSHPHLVRIRDLVAEGETLAIVMDLVEGYDLRRYLSRHGTLAPSLATTMIAQTASALVVVHEAGIIHRDLKPENILLDLSDGDTLQVRLSDFGISRLTFGPSLTRLSGVIGTPEYMAPELAEHDHGTPASDLYSLGIILYELLAGRTPFVGGHPVAVLRRHLEEDPRPLDQLPKPLWKLLEDLLEKDPHACASSAAGLVARTESLAPALDGLEPLPDQRLAADGAETDRVTRPKTLQRERNRLGARSESGTDDQPTYFGRRREQSEDAIAKETRRHRPRNAVLVALLGVAFLGIALGAGVGLAHLLSQPPASGSVRLDVMRLPNGLRLQQIWRVAGKKTPMLEGSLQVINSSSGPIAGGVDVVIPKQLASSVKGIVFDPQPEIVQADPVVRYSIFAPARKRRDVRLFGASSGKSELSRSRFLGHRSSESAGGVRASRSTHAHCSEPRARHDTSTPRPDVPADAGRILGQRLFSPRNPAGRCNLGIFRPRRRCGDRWQVDG